MGLYRRADYAIFVDLGHEPYWVYENMHKLIKWSIDNKGIPIIWLKQKNLLIDMVRGALGLITSVPAIPAFIDGGGGRARMLSRHCTAKYKIEQMEQLTRKLMGVKPYKHAQPSIVYLGISSDEVERLAHPQGFNQTNYYPLAGYSTTRESVFKMEGHEPVSRIQILGKLRGLGFAGVKSSSCTICPYVSGAFRLEMSDREWDNLRVAEWAVNIGYRGNVSSLVYMSTDLLSVEQLRARQVNTPSLFNCSDVCST